jgi:uncharacterized protein (DUF1697 family)
MALVVLLKGVNVGGHRAFRPSVLAKALSRLGVVNIGTAGTFVVRKAIGQAALRTEITRRLPFEAHVMICTGAAIRRLTSGAPFARYATRPDIVQFVSVLAKRPRRMPAMPLDIPAEGEWGVRVLGWQDRFVYGLYRRQMKAIGQFGQLERIFDSPATTRSWSTILTIERVLNDGHDHG